MSVLNTLDVTGRMFRLVPYGNMIIAGYAMTTEYLDKNRAELKGSNRDIPDTIICCGAEYRQCKCMQMRVKVSDKFVTCPHMLILYLLDGAPEPDNAMLAAAINVYSGQIDKLRTTDITTTPTVYERLITYFKECMSHFLAKSDDNSEKDI